MSEALAGMSPAILGRTLTDTGEQVGMYVTPVAPFNCEFNLLPDGRYSTQFVVFLVHGYAWEIANDDHEGLVRR